MTTVELLYLETQHSLAKPLRNFNGVLAKFVISSFLIRQLN